VEKITDARQLALKANDIRVDIINMLLEAGSGHSGGPLGLSDIFACLYFNIMNVNPKEPKWSERDRFVLSNGHCAPVMYAAMAEKGFFPKSWLANFGRFNSHLGGHPDCRQVPGVEASTGSLGHGLPLAVGMAMGLKIRKRQSKVYCLIGDGEANEGSVWEAVMLATQHRLDNLVCLVDYNHSTDRALNLGDLGVKFRSFGWQVKKINGHNHQEIFEALKLAHKKPLAIIAKTIKGYGVKEMENNPAWHHRSPTKEEMERILTELN